MRLMKIFLVAAAIYGAVWAAPQESKKLAYIVSDIRIPFWEIMSRGIEKNAEKLGYEVTVYSADNDARKELQAVATVIKERVDGIIVSPTNSSACVTILKLAKAANIPVVISDIGTDGGDYVSYIASDNRAGAYAIGQVLANELIKRGWQNGRVGIIAIPQARSNGKARTAGFMKAMEESQIRGAGIEQQVTFSYQETYDFATSMIERNADLRALWLQGSDRYKGALDAIADAGKTGEILLLCFDAEPEFLQMIPKGELVGAAMQQPFLMGEEAVNSMHDHLMGLKVKKNKLLDVLAVSTDNIATKLPIIKRNVLGLE
jgi:ABC-type sugar transport system substrate-binding protein